MKVYPLGGAQEVGRSGFIIEENGKKILLDYGVKFQEGPLREHLYPLDVNTKLDAVIISHAHMDHSGYAPHIYKTQTPPCFTAPPTIPLSKMLLEDSLKIARIENKKPPFSKRNIKDWMRNTYSVHYNQRVEIAKDVWIRLKDAGHIVGAAMTEIEFPKHKVVYTGDYNDYETMLMNKADFNFQNVKTLITEGTYGDRNHPDRKMEVKRFIRSVKETIEEGGHVLIPSFAVGRAQEILMMLHGHVNVPIYLDGMARSASDITLSYPDYVKNIEQVEVALKSARWIKHPRMREQALKEQSVIVTTAGMLQGGPVMYYMEEIKDQKRSKILLVGYQVEGTPGRILMDRGVWAKDDYELNVKATIEKYDFSAHTDKKGVIKNIKHTDSIENVIVVHSDKDVATRFSEELKDLGLNAIAPAIGEVVKL